MKNVPYLPYFLGAAAAFGAAKMAYAHADTADVRFLLAPTNALVEMMLNSASAFVAGRGFVHAGLGIVIDKSCAGGNFWLLSWLVLAVTYLRERGRHPAAALVALVPASFALTLLVNAARIVGAVRLGQVLPAALTPGWLHEAQGTLVYLFFLVAAHFGLLYLLTTYSRYRAHIA